MYGVKFHRGSSGIKTKLSIGFGNEEVAGYQSEGIFLVVGNRLLERNELKNE